MSRPELTGDASLFYTAKEARKYDSSSRMVGIQREITERALELLRLQQDDVQPNLILDIGCGSGLSGRVLEEHGHVWIGCDISRDMLLVAQERIVDQQQPNTPTNNNNNNDDDDDDEDDNGDEDDNDASMDEEEDEDEDETSGQPQKRKKRVVGVVSVGDVMHHDMGTGLPFRPASFDACISISALQWLCYANAKNQNPQRRLTRFFSSLYTVLKRGGRAVLQFYPETAEQAVLISETATRVGFTGGVVVDYPNSAKAKKHYLVLGFDRNNQNHHPSTATTTMKTGKAAAAAATQVQVSDTTGRKQQQGNNNNNNNKRTLPPKKKKGGTKTKEWVQHKKDVARQKGKEVRPDSKYTARRRPKKF